jgi:hypothetical protein
VKPGITGPAQARQVSALDYVQQDITACLAAPLTLDLVLDQHRHQRQFPFLAQLAITALQVQETNVNQDPTFRMASVSNALRDSTWQLGGYV